MPLCWMCDQITPWTLKRIHFDGIRIRDLSSCNTHHSSFQALEESATNCELCKLICDSISANSKEFGPSLDVGDPIHMGAWMVPPIDPESEVQKLSKIIVQCGGVFATLLAFSDPCSKAEIAQDVVGRLSPDAESPEQYEMVSNWLHNCMHYHPGCKLVVDQGGARYKNGIETVELPSRVLDIGASAASNIRLIESLGMDGQYAVLSHRWPLDPSQSFTTTTSNIDHRKSTIRLEDLPQTFQDAIKVTRGLRIRYLWIDSLCIIQDDAKDWEQQSVLMGKIYHQGTVTIMAVQNMVTTATSEQDTPPKGFLQRQALSLPTVKMNYYDRNWNIKGYWYLQNIKRYTRLNMELFTRGWVLQEEHLSRRKVIFTQEHVVWQCRSNIIHDVDRERYNKFKSAEVAEDDNFVGHWLSIAENYCQRSLTYDSDTLPALSGIAMHYSKRYGQEYYAGIFSGSILEGLLWRSAYAGSLTRRAEYIAPSWSWTSLKGMISTDILGSENTEKGLDKNKTRNLLEDVHFELYPDGENIYGKLKGGKMEVTGWLKTAEIYYEELKYPSVELRADGKAIAVLRLDLLEDIPPAGSAMEVECLYVLTDETNLYMLVLRRTDEQYTRLGATTADPAWFEEGGARKKTIVIL